MQPQACTLMQEFTHTSVTAFRMRFRELKTACLVKMRHLACFTVKAPHLALYALQEWGKAAHSITVDTWRVASSLSLHTVKWLWMSFLNKTSPIIISTSLFFQHAPEHIRNLIYASARNMTGLIGKHLCSLHSTYVCARVCVRDTKTGRAKNGLQLERRLTVDPLGMAVSSTRR